jgi:radical SAM protein with 4Fe4S-binding SPASM domain
MNDKQPVLKKMIALGYDLYPTNAFFELTYKCNCACKYCYIDQEKGKYDLKTSLVYKVLDKLNEAGIFHIIFTGGEIFIRPDILDILEYAISKDFWLIGLLTNGTILTKEQMDFIIKNKRYFSKTISMSIFSHIPEVNDSFFKLKGAFKKICDNGEYLIKNGIDVNLKINVMDFNLDTFMDTKSFFEKRGFNVTYIYGILYTNNDEFNSQKFSQKTFFKEYFKRIPQNEQEAYKKEFAEKMSSYELGELCTGRLTGICIDNMGNIKPCIGHYESDVNILENGSLREILSKSVLLKKVRNITKLDIVKCRNCKYIKYCTPCISEMYSEFKNFYEPPLKNCSRAEVLDEITN